MRSNVQKLLVLMWFGFCLFLFVIVDHPVQLGRVFPKQIVLIQTMYETVHPYFYREAHV
ncbi:hypothetical protein [Legionella jordanis]|uniref:Uncharacterized protein n=1 Tax=Legionella jordanis TaxID=456 RepID=A0A0W0VG05_9GAMM|nr:hypothetical protein [Legionella jordanis]KTD18971.1 hypothetical protein Ljor_0194 [Legionella jordanis]VEH13072.1 Uncharacterised protein [Legionella jordanis]